MRPDWLIQTNIDGVDTDPMVAEVLSQGMQAIGVWYGPLTYIDFDRYYSDRCAICYGDIDFVRHVIRRSKLIPGAWCNFNNMKCSTYYAHLGEHLLNQQYIMIPVGDLIRRWDELIMVMSNQSLFIRPDSGAKPFTGYIVSPKDKNKIQTLIQAVGPETLVVIAPEKEITAEWRFVVCNRKVVAGCQYLPIESPSYTDSSFRLAEIIASQGWQPDLCYTVDIAESEGNVYLLEINSFSCAGLYSCDIKAIVSCASAVAAAEWGEYCDPTITDA